jgi:hypothetical protein
VQLQREAKEGRVRRKIRNQPDIPPLQSSTRSAAEGVSQGASASRSSSGIHQLSFVWPRPSEPSH